MKKYILGIAVAGIFLVYSFALRHNHTKTVIAPASLSHNNSSSSTASTTPSTATASAPSTQYKDGSYTGTVADAFYGNVQVQAVISAGKITSVKFLQSPNENPNSIYINQQAMPYLKQETIQAQSSNVGLISGATLTSEAFVQSLSSALTQATQG